VQAYNRADIIEYVLGDKYMRVIDDLNNGWLFKKNTEVNDTLVVDESFDMINLPHTYNGFDGQDGGNDYYKGKAVYIKKLIRPFVSPESDFILDFEGVNSVARIRARVVLPVPGGPQKIRLTGSFFLTISVRILPSPITWS